MTFEIWNQKKAAFAKRMGLRSNANGHDVMVSADRKT